MTRFLFIIFTNLFVIVTFSHAQNMGVLKSEQANSDSPRFYNQAKEGYYWYKDPAPEEETEETEEESEKKEKHWEPNMQDYTEEQLWDLHPDEFQELQKAFLKKAVRRPSEENVADYLLMQDIAAKKSSAYASTVALVVQKNERFDMSDDLPLTRGGKVAVRDSKRDETDSLLAASRQSNGLMFFGAPNDPQTISMRRVVGYLEKDYQWEIRDLDIHTDGALASALNITQAPTLVVVSYETGDHLTVTRGVIDYMTLKRRLLHSIRYVNGERDADEFHIMDMQRGTGYDVNDPRKQSIMGE